MVREDLNILKIRPWTFENYTVKDLEFIARVRGYSVYPLPDDRYKRHLINSILLIREYQLEKLEAEQKQEKEKKTANPTLHRTPYILHLTSPM